MTGKEMVKLLKEHGWEVDRISGSHHIMIKDPFRACARKERPEKRDTASPIERGGTKMKIQYPLRAHKAEEGGFWAEFPDLPECLTEGDTLKETLDNAQEALSGWLASRFERNFEIPAASSVKGKNVYLVEPLPEVGIPLILRKIRTESGLSQKEVAKKLEITYQTYQMWEKPASANPTIKQLAKVANAVGKKLVLEIA